MKIGIVGSGTVGQTLGGGFLKHGHQVMLGTRNVNKSEIWAWKQVNQGGLAGSFEDVAKFGDLIVLATHGKVAMEALELAGLDNMAGKTILDATNPLTEEAPVHGVLRFFTGPNESLGERVQKKAPRSHVVKAFNSVGAGRMVNPHYEQGKPTMFLCGEDVSAKAQVEALILELGWEPFDCGGITSARALEPLCMLWCIPVFLHGKNQHAFKLLTK